MIYFKVKAIDKQTQEKLNLRIKTNGLMFWTENKEGQFINPYFNENKELFDAVLDNTSILNCPKNYMEGENNKYLIKVISNDL